MSEIAVSVRDITKKYRLFSSPGERLKEALHPFRKTYHREFWALRGVSFEVERGESLGILGRNGSGKSTLLQVVAGVLRPTSGEVNVNGPVAALLELGTGFNADFTGRDNIVFSGAMQGITQADMKSRAASIERFADIGDFIDQPVRTYSSGMFVRLAFAVAISAEPRILIVDEALSVGDAAFQRKCFERINEMKRNGTAILFVSHDEGTIANVCGRAIVMDGGQLSFSGSVRDSISHYHRLLNKGTQVRRLTKPGGDSDALAKANGAAPRPPAFADETEAFLKTVPASDNCVNRRSYNPSETRVGNGKCEIIDYLLVFDGEIDPKEISGKGPLDVYIKVRFLGDVTRPLVGFRIFTADYMKIFAQNTGMMGKTLTSMGAGDIGIYRFTVDLALAGGRYFFNMGIDEVTENGQLFADGRRGVAELKVRETPWCEGVVDISREFAESILPSR